MFVVDSLILALDVTNKTIQFFSDPPCPTHGDRSRNLLWCVSDIRCKQDEYWSTLTTFEVSYIFEATGSVTKKWLKLYLSLTYFSGTQYMIFMQMKHRL